MAAKSRKVLGSALKSTSPRRGLAPFKEAERRIRNFKTRFLTANLVTLIFMLSSLSPLLSEDKNTIPEEMLKRRQKVEFMSFFLKDAKDAKLPTAATGVEYFNQAVGYYQKNEYELAKQALKQSLELDDQNVFAYELMGDIHNHQQNLKEAKSNYEIAYNLNANPELKKKIESLGREAKAEKKLATYSEEHFLIKYHNQDRSMEGFELREILRQAYRDISKDFAYYFNHKIVVLLLDEEEFKNITNLPHWVGGVYDGKIRMPVNKKGFTEKDLKATTIHEVTHAFVAAMSSSRAPAWINEGLAQVEENKFRKIDMLVFDAAIKTNTLLPLDQLISERVAEKQDQLWVLLFYQQSFHLTNYLVKRYGMFNLKKMLAEFAKGKNSDEAIRAVLQISPVRLEKEWRATFTK